MFKTRPSPVTSSPSRYYATSLRLFKQTIPILFVPCPLLLLFPVRPLNCSSHPSNTEHQRSMSTSSLNDNTSSSLRTRWTTSAPSLFFMPALAEEPSDEKEDPENTDYIQWIIEAGRNLFRISVSYLPQVLLDGIRTWPGAATGIAGVWSGAVVKWRLRNYTVIAVSSFFLVLAKASFIYEN